jgi:hypothetical protein
MPVTFAQSLADAASRPAAVHPQCREGVTESTGAGTSDHVRSSPKSLHFVGRRLGEAAQVLRADGRFGVEEPKLQGKRHDLGIQKA